MQWSRKSALAALLAAAALTGVADSSTAALSHPAATAVDPCPLPLPMDAIEPAALSPELLATDAIRAGDGLVPRAWVTPPPAANTGFGCPIERTTG